MLKKVIIILIISIFLIFTILLLTNKYLISLIKYGKSDIDDYKIFNNSEVETYETIDWELSNNYNKAKISDEVLKEIEANQTVAFIVIQDGKIIYEKYGEDYTAESKINSFSIAKGIISILVGIAIDDGKIQSLDQKVSDFLPEFGNGVTIKDLLTMSSGLDWSEKFNNPFSDVVKAYYTEDLHKLIFSKKITGEHGRTWNYQCGNTIILSYLIEKATGKKINEYASEKLWKRIGAEQNAQWSLDYENGEVKSFCCFFATARDFARLGQLVLNQGTFDDIFVVSEQYIKDATKPADYLVNNENNKIENYGYHFWIYNYEGHKIPYFRGMWGQYIFVIPDKNAVVVRFGKRLTKDNFQGNSSKAVLYLKAAFEILN